MANKLLENGALCIDVTIQVKQKKQDMYQPPSNSKKMLKLLKSAEDADVLNIIMKLDTKTVNVLKNFSLINPSILFKEGNVITTISPSKTIMAKAVVPTQFEKKFAIYNLVRFIGSLSLFNDPVLTFKDKFVTIADGDKSVNYTFADEATIKAPPEKEIKLPSVDVSFTLTDAHLKEVIKALGVLQLPEIAVVGDGKNVLLQAIDSKNPSGDTYSVNVGTTNKTFRVIFKGENLLKIFAGDYEVEISSKGISHFKGADPENWIAIEASSTF